MIIFASPQAVSIYAGFFSGATVGICLATPTEMRRRGAILLPVDHSKEALSEKGSK